MVATPSLHIQKQIQEVRYEIVRNLMVRIVEIKVQDIDTAAWVVAARVSQDTNKTQAELIAELTLVKDTYTAQQQEEIDKVSAAVEA
jgi:hypothetical protein